jgi:cytochrome c
MGNPGRGAEVFSSPQDSGNQFSCANCHGVSEDAQGFSTAEQLHRPAHPLFNVDKRNSYYNGNSTVLFDAVNICLEDWMAAETWSESSTPWLDLDAYFQQESSDEVANNITSTQLIPITDFSKGDIATGQSLFNQSCATCHGENTLGSTIAGNLTLLNLSIKGLAEKVRRSGSTSHRIFPDLSGGNMPFWSQERLSDTKLVDIAVYVISISQSPAAGTRQCSENDHEKVGLVANLSTLAHRFSGRAEIIDNSTIQITNFNFEGNAPNVVFYGAVNPGARAHD